MAHMSPRLKMRRGRFGLGGFFAPILKIISPLNGATVQSQVGSPDAGIAVTFIGTAADDVGGDLSSSIVWEANIGSPTVGSPTPTATGATVILTLRGIGSPVPMFSPRGVLGSPLTGSPIGSPQVNLGVTHTITATSTDAGGKVSTQQITITVISKG